MTATLIKLAEEIGLLLKKRQLTLTTAESCTGGGLSYFITHIAGSSAWFDRGFVTYSNQAKIDLLGVQPHTLDTFGAVSEETANEMAKGALARSQTDFAVAITGIAGPLGGQEGKPVGTVWIAWALRRPPFVTAKKYSFSGNRHSIRTQAMEKALEEGIANIQRYC